MAGVAMAGGRDAVMLDGWPDDVAPVTGGR